MKNKVFAILMVIVLGLSLCGCNKKTAEEPKKEIPITVESSADASTEAIAEIPDVNPIESNIEEPTIEVEEPTENTDENIEEFPDDSIYSIAIIGGKEVRHEPAKLPKDCKLDDDGYVIYIPTGEKVKKEDGTYLGNYIGEDGVYNYDILTDEEIANFEAVDKAHEEFQERHSAIDITETSGTLETGHDYTLPAGDYKFSITPEIGMSGIHIYSKDTDAEVYNTTLVYDEANGIVNNEEIITVPENSYIHATLVNFEKVN